MTNIEDKKHIIDIQMRGVLPVDSFGFRRYYHLPPPLLPSQPLPSSLLLFFGFSFKVNKTLQGQLHKRHFDKVCLLL